MKPKLSELSYNDYLAISESGMLWEYYPESTGDYRKDVLPFQNKTAKYQWSDNGCTCKAVVKDDIIKIKAVSGYSSDVNTLLKLKDTGNGFIAKIPSYSCTHQDNYICFDYAEADYLYKALQVWFAEEKLSY